ncbi:MAG: site-specific integrase [Alphaproteobacteria bacterium]|nr:site-specific integrase [Alphaproteobacteria bacterium]
MKVLFTEKFIRELRPEAGKERLEIADERCPYLYCRVSPLGGKTYAVIKKVQGKTVRVTLGKTNEISLDFARRQAFDCLQKIRQGINPNEEKRALSSEMTLGELFQEYVERYAKEQTSLKTLRDNISLFKRRFSHWSGKRISELQTKQIETLMISLRDKDGISASNKALTLLRHMYNKAIQWGWNGRNPTTGIAKYKLASRERFVLPEEFKKLFDAIDGDPDPVHRTFFYALLYTGQRCGNVLEMRWEHINFTNAIWYIPRTKNGTSMSVPLVKQLVVLLKNLKRESVKSEWVFPMGDDATRHMGYPQKAWKRLKQTAGIDNLRMHDLRRTVASYECMNGENLSVVSRTLNHKTLAATQVYARVDTSAVSRALQKTVNLFEQIASQKEVF